MTDTEQNAVLGDVLIDLTRCLLQYVGECWPWTGEDESEKRTIDELVARQKQSIGRIVQLLSRRRRPVDFGAYPTEFTDLHFLALHHLLGRLVENEQALIGVLERSAKECAGDDEAVELVQEIASAEHLRLEQLRELAARHASGHSLESERI